MKSRFALFAIATPLLGAYAYYYSDSFSSLTSNWVANGSVNVSGGLFTSNTAGALISTVPVQGQGAGISSYEVDMTLALPASGGSYVAYLRASSNALLSATGATGTFYAVELGNVTRSGGSCSATVSILKSISGSVSTLSTTAIPCWGPSGLKLIAAMNGAVEIAVFVNSIRTLATFDSSIASGQPGLGVIAAPSGDGFSTVGLGPITGTPPNPVNSQTIATAPYSNRVDFAWQPTTDTNGPGIAEYNMFRNGTWIWTGGPTENTFTDTTVSPGTTYTYMIGVGDFQEHWSYTTVSVTTPPTGDIDPRQVGARPSGSYWGGAGEQIDMRSGNLNFTLPLIAAQGRAGTGVGFRLSYNSQNWRQDNGGTWQLGRDVGYGYGWRLQAGSLTPVYNGWYVVHHYLFIDATGAEYRLTQNNSGVWTSMESGLYLQFDSNHGLLHFPDGSQWVLGCVSGGTEQDAGTMYPTLIQDSNGNQILLQYYAGLGMSQGNSSARIQTIEDHCCPN